MRTADGLTLVGEYAAQRHEQVRTLVCLIPATTGGYGTTNPAHGGLAAARRWPECPYFGSIPRLRPVFAAQ